MQAAKLIGNSPLLTNYAYSCSFFNINSIYAQSLRWRKPIWLPTAKSKVFRVPVKPKIPEDEAKEIQRLYNNYRTYMKSIKRYFRELNESNRTATDPAVLQQVEDEDYAKCMEINDAWNKEIVEMREVRLKEEKEARHLRVLEAIEQKKVRDAQIQVEVEEKVRQAKLVAPTFITEANIDQAIEEALANSVDYNKALDLDGTWYTDKSGLPPTSSKASTTTTKPPKIETAQISQ